MNSSKTPLFPVYANMANGENLANRFNLLGPQMKWADARLSVLQNDNNGYNNLMDLPAVKRKRVGDLWLENVRAFMAMTEAGLRHIRFSLDLLIYAFEHTQLYTDKAKHDRGYNMCQTKRTAWNNLWRHFASLIHTMSQKVDLVCLSDNAALHQHNLSDILPPGEVLRHVNLSVTEKKQMFWEAIQLWEAFKMHPRESEAYCSAYTQLVSLTWRVRGGHAIQQWQATEAFEPFADPTDPGDLSQEAIVTGPVPASPDHFHITEQTSPTSAYQVPTYPDQLHTNPRIKPAGPIDPPTSPNSGVTEQTSSTSPYNLSQFPDQVRTDQRFLSANPGGLPTYPDHFSATQQLPPTSSNNVASLPRVDQHSVTTEWPPVPPGQYAGLWSPFEQPQQVQLPNTRPDLQCQASSAQQAPIAPSATPQAYAGTPFDQQTSSTSGAPVPRLSSREDLAWEGYSHEDFSTYQDLSTPMDAPELDKTLEDFSR